MNVKPILDKLDTRYYVKALCLNVAHDCNLRVNTALHQKEITMENGK